MLHQFGLLQGHCAEDHPIQAEAEQRFGALEAAHPTAELHRNGEGRCDGANGGIIGGFTAAGPIEVHQMQSAGPLALPFQGLRYWVFAEASDLVVIALMKPDAGALQQVDGGNDLHGAGRSLLPSSPTAVSAECCGIQAGGRWKS